METRNEQEALTIQIKRLEDQIQEQKTRLAFLEQSENQDTTFKSTLDSGVLGTPLIRSNSIHALLLLSDSALPLGSFAYSSGLESFLAHRKHGTAGLTTKSADFRSFLHLSISSVAYTNIPYLLAAFRDPERLQDLDNDLDASTPCTVARRASIAQGRALLGVWERSFRSVWDNGSPEEDRNGGNSAAEALRQFSQGMKTNSDTSPITSRVNGHFAPVWGTTSRVMGLEAYQSAYIFLVNHAKAVLSAAVRASVLGPYQAQSFLAGEEMQHVVAECLEMVKDVDPEDAGQLVPSLDLWVGRHELLYSRIFNS